MTEEPFDLAKYLDEQIARLRAQVAAGDEEAAAKLHALESRLDEYEAGGITPAAGAEGDRGLGQTRYASVQEWVETYFVQCYVRPLGGEWRWCPRWWDHAEAITRLEALWRSWEALSRDPALGMATWLTQHLDPQLPQLMGNRGPFARCSDERHEAAKPMRIDPPPDGWWESPDEG
ncbi:MAG: DUF4913 domain-containing protein [Jiangellaceae bacterium]